MSRPWFAEDADIDRVGFELATSRAQNQMRLGRFGLKTGWLLIVWSAEEGADIINIKPVDGLALDLSVGDSGVIAAVHAGRYACYHDEVTDGSSHSQRPLIAGECPAARCRARHSTTTEQVRRAVCPRPPLGPEYRYQLNRLQRSSI
jgi:hypothetical protein